jgi:hypothetical protein
MIRTSLAVLATLFAFASANAQTMILSTSNSDYQVTPVFSDVGAFSIHVEIDAPMAPGVYVDPPIIRVTYQVTGALEAGTPSGFPAFDLQRDISGEVFYEQGSSLRFEIAQNAVLSDGVQAVELVGGETVLTYNAREVDNGRFHPALLELNANGTGRIQNSDNIPTLNPLLEVAFGEEYITDLAFDPGNTTLIIEPNAAPPRKSGGGSSSPLTLAVLVLLGLLVWAFQRRTRAVPTRH